MRIVQSEGVTQRIEQRHVRIGIDRVVVPVDVELELLGHGGRFLPRGDAASDAAVLSFGVRRGRGARGRRIVAGSLCQLARDWNGSNRWLRAVSIRPCIAAMSTIVRPRRGT